MSGGLPPNWDFYRDDWPPLAHQYAYVPRPPKDKPKITGYRALTDAEIALINRVKAKAEEVRELLIEVQQHNTLDHRWLAIGQTDLQKGFMAVIRAVARPETF